MRGRCVVINRPHTHTEYEREREVNLPWQIAADVAPSEKGEAVPGGQGMHALRPVVLLYVAGPQAMQ